MAEKTTNETDPDISGILRLIEESDKEGEKLLTSSLAFINSRRPLTTYTIPRLNPHYGKKRGDWMMEEPAVTKPTACRTAPSPVRKKPVRHPESTPEARARAVPPGQFKAIKHNRPMKAPPQKQRTEPKPPIPVKPSPSLAITKPEPTASQPTALTTLEPGTVAHAAVIASAAFQGVMRKIAALRKENTPGKAPKPINIRLLPARPAMPKPEAAPTTTAGNRKKGSGKNRRKSFYHKEGETMWKVIEQPNDPAYHTVARETSAEETTGNQQRDSGTTDKHQKHPEETRASSGKHA
ncbi:hypothetical protein PV328_007690 [Microctonus aethiopoides]|uniref:Uncharacterized protein n=1 Tax=Microctonus aethiopoides TaxID=144406 RepID=A0AA39EYY8_9HYME|nr:hypothetical protein PV328_007690 [Microctonus aethiopoides]